MVTYGMQTMHYNQLFVCKIACCLYIDLGTMKKILNTFPLLYRWHEQVYRVKCTFNYSACMYTFKHFKGITCNTIHTFIGTCFKKKKLNTCFFYIKYHEFPDIPLNCLSLVRQSTRIQV